MALTVHHLRRSQSERIVWLCEELRDLFPDFKYEVVIHQRDPFSALAPAELRTIHPAGTAPIMVDETQETKIVLAESQAIVEYIIQIYGQGCFCIQPTSLDYANYLTWYNFANGSFQACLTRVGTIDMLVKMFRRMQGASSRPSTASSDSAGEEQDSGTQLAKLAESFAKRGTHHLAMIDARLGEARYLAGDSFSAADLMTVFSLTTMRGFRPFSLAEYPNILRYLGQISKRPAYLRALERAEPGMKPMVGAEVEMFDFGVLRELA